MVFNDPLGRRLLAEERGLSAEVMDALPHMGISSVCNVLAAVKTARLSAPAPSSTTRCSRSPPTARRCMRASSAHPRVALRRALRPRGGARGAVASPRRRVHREHPGGLRREDRDRIFNLGYFTWVEQQGVPLADFEAPQGPRGGARCTRRSRRGGMMRSARSTGPSPRRAREPALRVLWVVPRARGPAPALPARGTDAGDHLVAPQGDPLVPWPDDRD